MEWMPQAIRDGIIVVLIISGPLVLAAALIGLIIGVLQAATQVQEQTIGSALKIIGVFGLVIFAGFWMFQYLNQYTSRSLNTAFTLVPNLSQKVIPKDTYTENQFKRERGGKVIPPKQIENKEAIGRPAPGAPILGAPELPKHPPVKDILPATAPQIPSPPSKPNLPLSNIQELKLIPPPPIQGTPSPKTPLINLVPGEPAYLKKELEVELWQRKEAFGENLENKTANDDSQEENLPSWLN